MPQVSELHDPLLLHLVEGQGRTAATLEAIATRIDGMAHDKADDHAALDRRLDAHAARLASIERTLNRATGLALGLGIGAGAVGGGVGALVSNLLGG